MKLYDQFKSTLERYLLRGAFYQLLAVAALIGLISLLAGLLVRAGVDDAGTASESIWWAFLRLTDPGYLGDDMGVFRRVVSTVVTVLGYVLFMGSLVAIMTQWLNRTMSRLASGYTPISRKNHILILGWTARAGIVVGDLLNSSGRVKRFLKLRGARRLHLVLLADTVTPALMQELRTRAGARFDPNQVTLRSGSALRGEHLKRVDFLNASVVLLPAGEFTPAGPENIDTHTIKALLSLSNHPDVTDRKRLPLAVAEVLDERKAEIARSAYAGPVEILASDTMVSQLIAQNIRHRGLSHVYSELLTHRMGNEIFIRHLPNLQGQPLCSVYGLFSKAVVLGVVSAAGDAFSPRINAPCNYVLQADDRLALVARDYADTEPELTEASDITPQEWVIQKVPLVAEPQRPRRVLIVGWSHKVPRLLKELSRGSVNIEIDVASMLPISQRQATLDRHWGGVDEVPVRLLEVEYTDPRAFSRLDAQSYDNVVFMGSDWVHSRAESDARTIVGYLVLQKLLSKHEKRPDVLVELLDAENVGLLGERPGEVLISPVILSHMLAQVALRRELNAVFNELFAFRGAEIGFRSCKSYGLLGRTVYFAEVVKVAAERGETALGFALLDASNRSEIKLNPPRNEAFELRAGDDVIVVADTEDRAQKSRHPPPA
jgi:hypothetical protein